MLRQHGLILVHGSPGKSTLQLLCYSNARLKLFAAMDQERQTSTANLDADSADSSNDVVKDDDLDAFWRAKREEADTEHVQPPADSSDHCSTDPYMLMMDTSRSEYLPELPEAQDQDAAILDQLGKGFATAKDMRHFIKQNRSHLKALELESYAKLTADLSPYDMPLYPCELETAQSQKSKRKAEWYEWLPDSKRRIMTARLLADAAHQRTLLGPRRGGSFQ